MISQEIQVIVESISVRFNEDDRNLFGVRLDELTDREQEILSEHVGTDNCLSCSPQGIECEGPFLTFWRDSKDQQIQWHGKRECIPVSNLLNNTLSGINEVSDHLKNFDPDKVTELLDISNIDELGEKIRNLKPPKSIGNIMRIIEDLREDRE